MTPRHAVIPRLQPGLPVHFIWLRGVVAAIILMNLVDAMFTIVWVDLGAATEANPLMSVLLGLGTVPFALGKVLLVSLGCVILWRYQHRPLAIIALFLIFIMYYAVMVQHMIAVGYALFT